MWGGRSRQGGGRGHGAAHAGRRRPPDGSMRQLSGALRAGGGLPVAGRGRCLRWADAGQPLGGAAAHAAGWRCIDLVATGIARVPARLDSPRDVRGRARDRGRARRWLWHRVGLRPRHDQAGLGDTRMGQGANLNRKNGEAGQVRLVYGVQSLPVGAPVIVDVIFEIEPLAHSTSRQ